MTEMQLGITWEPGAGAEATRFRGTAEGGCGIQWKSFYKVQRFPLEAVDFIAVDVWHLRTLHKRACLA